jgi:hypothetical protein
VNRTERDQATADRIKAIVAAEEERGPIVPGGAQGGVIATARRVAADAAARARARVRRLFQALDESHHEAL